MYKNEVERLLAEGLAQLEASGTLAKAAQGGNNPLDSDFDELDDAKSESDEHQDDDQDGKTGDGDDSDDDSDDDSGDDDSEDDSDDDSDDDTDDSEPAQPKPGGVVAKAVDAMPLLEAIESRLGEIVAANDALRGENAELRTQLGVIAKAVTGLSDGTQMIAKAVSGRMDTPMKPRHLQGQKVNVPTGTVTTTSLGMTAAEVFSKAEQAVEAGKLGTFQLSLLNGMVNQHGVDGALAQMPEVYAVLKGGN